MELRHPQYNDCYVQATKHYNENVELFQIGDYVFAKTKFNDDGETKSITVFGWEKTYDNYGSASPFTNTNGYTSLTVSEGVTTIDDYAFSECYSLKTITVGEDSASFCVQDNILFNSDKTKLIIYPAKKTGTEYVIPDTVTAIANAAFSGTPLEKITVPNGVTEIPAYAFESCAKLKEVVLPAGITNIGKNAFYKATALTDVWFGGTEEQWNAITVDSTGNDILSTATIHYTTPHSHSYSDTVVAPTCTSQGYTEHQCSTCTSDGTKTALCDNNCGYSDTVTVEGSALGHNFENGTCTECGEDDPDYDSGEHNSDCDCICHKTNRFVQFIYKIVRWFWKLFNIRKTCDCGVVHY